MAHLEELLKMVGPAELRAQLEEEIAGLKNHTRFGLVYERHIPETVIVGDTDGLRVGDHVRPREDADNGEDFRVTTLKGDSVSIVSLKSGQESKRKLSDLFVIRRFGDPADVALTSLDSIQRSSERPFHAAIEGENFHVLQLLVLPYEQQVDC